MYQRPLLVIRQGQSLALRLIVMSVLLVAVFSRVNLADVTDRLQTIHPFPLVTSVLLVYFAWLVNTLKWQRLLSSAGINRGIGELFHLNLTAILYGLALPGQVTGEVIKALRLGSRVDRRGVVSASVFLDRVTGLVGLSLVGILGLTFGPHSSDDQLSSRIYLAVLFGILAMSLVILVLPKIGWPAVYTRHHQSPRGWTAYVGRWREKVLASTGLQMSWVGLGTAIALACLFQSATVASNWTLSLGLGLSVSPLALAWVTSAVSLLQVIPISIAGIGVREASFVALLALYGVPANHALSISLAVFLLIVLLGLTGWLLDIVTSLRSARPTNAASLIDEGQNLSRREATSLDST
jgi:uncharacterized protein (TIRG00374 family)